MNRYFFLFILLTASYTVQKRHFTKGYDIQWKSSYASNSNDLSALETEISNPCDTIINKDGSVILASVERMDSKKIYVAPCENRGFSNTEIDRTSISTIHYANGALFENKTPEQLQKEREENLQKYRENQKEREAELLRIQQERLVVENQKLKAEVDSLKKEKSQGNTSSIDREENINELNDDRITEPVFEPLMRTFFIIGFAIAGLTILLTLVDPFYGAISLIGLVALFVTDVVSPFIVLASLIKKRRNKGKFKGRPVLLELLFALVSFGTLLLWIFLQF